MHRVALGIGEDLRRHVALLVDLAPIDAVDERRHPDRIHVRAIQDVHEPVLVEVGGQLLPVEVEQDVLHHGVVVPQVVRRVLEVRLDLAAVGVHGDTGVGEEVVALANPSVEVGTRVAGPVIQKVQVRVVGGRDPAIRAAARPGLTVGGPGLGPGLAGLRHHVAPPHALAGLELERIGVAAHPELAAGLPTMTMSFTIRGATVALSPARTSPNG